MFTIRSLFSIGELLRLLQFNFAVAALGQRLAACWTRRFSVVLPRVEEVRPKSKGSSIMRKLMIAAALVSTAVGTPALARDGSAYVGLDVGLLRPSRPKIRLTTCSGTFENAIRVRHKLGIDADAVFGYDFGMFRLEGELGYKDAKTKDATASSNDLNFFD